MSRGSKLTVWIAPTVALVAMTASAQTTVVAESETSITASHQSGSHVDTRTAFDTVEALTEAESSGNPRKRESQLEHVWHFNVPSGPSARLLLRAARSDSGEGDAFEFSWSIDQGQTYVPCHTLTHTALPAQIDEIPLPAAATGGAIWMRVVDTDRRGGNTVLDTLTVDYLAIVVDPQAPPPPSDFALEQVDTGPKHFEDFVYGAHDAQGRFGAVWHIWGAGPAPERRLVEARSGSWSTDDLPANIDGVSAHGLDYDATGAPVTISGPGRLARRDPVRGWEEEVFDSGALLSSTSGALVANRATGELFVAYAKANSPKYWKDGWGLWLGRRAPGGAWVRQLVDRDVRASFYPPSIALGPLGLPGIAYRKARGRDPDALGYAHWNGASWDVEVADPVYLNAQSPNLAYHPLTGAPAITHGDRFLQLVGAAWQAQVVPSAAYGGSFAFDAMGNAHVAYTEAGGALVVLAWDGVSWGNRRILDARPGAILPEFGRFVSIDPASQEIAIAYHWNGSDLWVGRRTL